MAVLKNRAKMSTSTTGTGTITLGSAESGYQTFADAGVANADVVRYVIEDTGGAFEIGTGTYTSSGTTLTRTVSESSNSNNAINLSGSATVFIGATAEDILSDVVDDTTPQLGGNLDVQTREITTSTTNGNVKLTPNGTGAVEVKGAGGNDGTLQLNCSDNSHGVKIKSPPHSAAASYTLTLPDDDGAASEFLQTDGSGNLSWAAGGGGDPDLYRDNASSPTTPLAGGANGVAIGSGSNAGGSGAIALGVGSAAGDGAFCAINGGGNTSYGAVGNRSIAMGEAARASASDAVAIGENAYAQGAESFSIGTQTDAIGTRAGAFAYNALAQGNYSMAFGNAGAFGTSSFAAAIDNNTNTYGATGANSIALGDRSKASGSRGIAISGFGALASGTSSLAFGYQATANQTYASGFGYASKAYGAYSWAGTESHALGSKSVALGLGDSSTSYGALHDNGVALGYQATTSAAKQIALGSSTAQVKISGAYTLPTADGTNGQVLTTDGSGAVTFADAGGGGGADLYAANEVSVTAQPSATGNDAVAIGDSAVSSGANAFAIGNTAAATAELASAFGYGTDATGQGSLAVGYLAQATTSRANAIGWARASGTDSFAAAITNNTSSYGASGISSIAGGYLNKASSSDSLCWGGDSNICHNSQSAIVGGQLNDCSGGYSFITGGYNNRILAGYSRAGGKDADTGDNLGKDAYASGKFSSRGDCQTAKRILMRSTTDATATVLTAQGNAPNTTNQVILPNNSCYGFTGTVIARENSAQTNDFAVWEIKGGAVRAANAASTTLGSYNINKISESTGAANWSIALSADTTNGAVAITVTGEASHSIRWVATVNTTEVTY